MNDNVTSPTTIGWSTATVEEMRTQLSTLIRLAQGNLAQPVAVPIALIQRFAATLDYAQQERRLIIHVSDNTVTNVFADRSLPNVNVRIIDTTPTGAYEEAETVFIDEHGERSKCERKDVEVYTNRAIVDRLWDAPEWATPQKYLATGGKNCPCCGDTDIVGGTVEVSEGTATQDVSCNACDAQWIDEYRLVNYRESSIG